MPARPRGLKSPVAEVVDRGLKLPEVEISTSYGTPALKVRGKLLVRLRPELVSLVFFGVPIEEREFLIEANPSVYHTTPHYQDYPAVLVRLEMSEPDLVWAYLIRRWRGIAPKRLAANASIPVKRPA